jgi:hypothetical protein
MTLPRRIRIAPGAFDDIREFTLERLETDDEISRDVALDLEYGLHGPRGQQGRAERADLWN